MSDPRREAVEAIKKAVDTARTAERQRCVAIVANLAIAAIIDKWTGESTCQAITSAIQAEP
jgi:hypothetical protein